MGICKVSGGLIWESGKLKKNEEIKITVENMDDFEVHLAEGSLILPGLVDFHCHLWAPGASVGVTSTEILSSGVIACGDAGTFGYNDWENANRLWQSSPLKVRSWLSVLPEGLTIHPNPNPTPIENISTNLLVETGLKNEEDILGFKIRLGQVDKNMDRALLAKARQAAELSDLKIMVHLTDTFLSIDEVVETLRPGDVLTHPYHGSRGNILNTKGEVSQSFIRAVNDGLLLDVGQGSKHFSWRVFEQAVLNEGIKPNMISSDLVRNTWKKEPVVDMSYIVSRFIAAGLSEEEVLNSMLLNAIDFMKVDIDFTKNLLVLEPDYTPVNYSDSDKRVISSNVRYQPRLHIFNEKLLRLDMPVELL